MNETTLSQRIQSLLEAHRQGRPEARDGLLSVACQRLEHMTRRMLHDYPGVKGWEQTGDVFQNAALRLRRALEQVSPGTVKEFMGLAALQIRRELIDLARHYAGRKGHDFAGPRPAAGRDSMQAIEAGESTHDPKKLVLWSEFHRRVGELPTDERESVDLLWYQELSQEEAAEVLGVDKSTVKRRWRAARLKLADLLKDELPVG